MPKNKRARAKLITGPARATLSVGFYAPQEGYRLAVSGSDGALLGDALELGEVAVLPNEDGSAIPNALRQNFSDEVLLLGYEYDDRRLAPGEKLGITLYWQALAEEIPDYEVQLRLLDESGWIMETLLERPQAGKSSGQSSTPPCAVPRRRLWSPGRSRQP